MTEPDLARALDAIMAAAPEDLVARLTAVAAASDGPTWSRATFELALYWFGQAEFARARTLARAVLAGPPHRREPIAQIRAEILVHNATDWLHEPLDVLRVVEATRAALAARLAYDAGVGFETLAHFYLGVHDRARTITSYDAAIRCYLQSWSGAAAPGCLLRLARLAVEDGDRDRARRLVDIGLAHARKFPPFATRTIRPALERLRAELVAMV